ncbi:SRPBCC family protein [Pediococcus stilesii]|uniref:SRPBCC family protein n=1 Tax=Pediococcus stilesii TaxID=331679 RepID=A0A5R9BW26_9LACO|nr:SRPBCC family protein [Pediococcus stilesii]TLQ04493.1 SRPBCC family protein [Pediococcus stilesii]
MQQKLFSNVVTVDAESKQVQQVLANPQYLLEWVPEITMVKQNDKKFTINRAETALNQHEVVRVKRNANEIRYVSTEGRLEYEIAFLITGEGKRTIIQEDVYVPEKAHLHLPLKLLAPIAKHAFNTNLNNLASLIEKISI